MPAATAAALPPDEPPGLRSRFQGLRVAPQVTLWVSAFQPSSGVFVLPTITQPAARSRATSSESAAAGDWPANAADPRVVGKPAASSRSFTPMGMPASGPTRSPRATHRSISRAAAMAASSSTATNAFTCSSSSSMRARA